MIIAVLKTLRTQDLKLICFQTMYKTSWLSKRLKSKSLKMQMIETGLISKTIHTNMKLIWIWTWIWTTITHHIQTSSTSNKHKGISIPTCILILFTRTLIYIIQGEALMQTILLKPGKHKVDLVVISILDIWMSYFYGRSYALLLL